MKYIKKINEFFDDDTKSYNDISKDELKNIVNRKYRKRKDGKILTDLSYGQKDDIVYNDSGKDMLSLSMVNHNKLLKKIPSLRFFKMKFEDFNDGYKLSYILDKEESFGVFNLEIDISKFSDYYHVMFHPFIQLREKINTDEFRVKNYELSSHIDDMIDELKSDPKYKNKSNEELLKLLELIYSDLEDGHIVDDNLEDMEYIKDLHFAKFKVSEKELDKYIKDINANIKTYDLYTQKLYSYSVFN